MGDLGIESFDLKLLGVDIGGTFIRSAVVGLNHAAAAGIGSGGDGSGSSGSGSDGGGNGNSGSGSDGGGSGSGRLAAASSFTRQTPAGSWAPSSSESTFSSVLLGQAQQSRPEGALELVEAISQIADSYSQELGAAFDAVGVGCAGFVENGGVVQHSPNIASLENFPLQLRLEERLGCVTRVENDAAAAAWAEAKLGVGAGAGNLVFLSFGTGIGGALVTDGKLHRGAHGFGAEPGHMTVVADGIPCPCGRRGCWERYASGTALGRYARQAVGSDSTSAILKFAGGSAAAVEGEHVTAALAQADSTAQAVMEQLCDWIAVGLNNVVVLTNPELVILGGGLSDIGNRFLAAVRRFYEKRYQAHETRPQFRIELATYGDNSGSVGAALLAADALLV